MKAPDELTTTSDQRSELLRLLSGVRLTGYVTAAGTGPPASHDEIDLYVYNMALAGALLGPLHVLEVVTRNAMHDLLVVRAGRPDWWAEPSVRCHLRVFGKEQVVRAQAKASRGRRAGDPAPTADDVVAATDFGFWTDLVSGAYERTLWQDPLRRVFRGTRRSRAQIFQALQSHRRLRNRVTHHEPLHDRDTLAEYSRVIQSIGYVSEPVAQWVDDRSRLGLVARSRPGGSTPAVRHF